MKQVTYILLVVIAFTVFVTMTLFTLTILNDGGSFLGSLNVCHSAAPALSPNGEMPCIGLVSCTAPPTLFVSLAAPVQPVFMELILTSSKEHPPRS